MEKVAGIIAEYNPFHNGHVWQINKIKEKLGDIPIVAVMSGHFLQRGQATILDKWSRAQIAVQEGIDLVIELPFIYSCRSAQYFAQGGVEIFNATNIVTNLCFGIEENSIEQLEKVAQISLTDNFQKTLKTHLQAGNTYAKAIELSLENSLDSKKDFLHGSNNILAIEYLKALAKTNSPIKPLGIKRQTAQHLDNKIYSDIASATAIRHELKTNKLSDNLLKTLPLNSQLILKEKYQQKQLLLNENIIENLLFYRLRQLTPNDMLNIADISEGLENRITKAAYATTNLTDLIEAIVSKRYPQTRILRILTQLLVANDNTLKHSPIPYIRVLAFNDIGRKLIKKIRSKTVFPLIINLPDFKNKQAAFPYIVNKSLMLDVNATDIFQILLKTNITGLDYKQQPIYL